MTIRTPLLTIALFALGLSSAPAATLINGSFEDGPVVPGRFGTYGAGFTGITGWTVGGGGINYFDNENAGLEGTDGNKTIDLNHASPGSITQVIQNLKIGEEVTIRFDYLSGRSQPGELADRSFSISSGSDSRTIDFQAYPRGASLDADAWFTTTFTFTAENTSQALTFANLSPGANGVILDNVRIASPAPVPVPAPLAMFLTGLGALGVTRVLRR
ncbi:MAG: DUF642 domain-containing protein [Pseudomonadota bacterium]